MHHLETVRAVPHFAVAEDAHAGRELIGLALVEMEESQHQRRARIVADRDAQLRPIAETALDRLDDADDLRAFAGAKLADRRHVRAILVAQRQMKPQILHALESEARQRFGKRGADAGQRGNGQQAGISGGRLRRAAERLRHLEWKRSRGAATLRAGVSRARAPRRSRLRRRAAAPTRRSWSVRDTAPCSTRP